MNALSGQRGFPIGELSFAITLFFLCGCFGGVWVARLLERMDIRWIMTAGALVSGLALGLAGRAESVVELYWLYALFGLGNSGVSLIPATTLVTRWFPGVNRSMALATASTGLSLGGVLITPVCAVLIERLGVEVAMLRFGAIYPALLLPLVWLFVRMPAAIHSNPSPTGGTAYMDGWAESDALRSRFFLLFTTAYFLIFGAQVGGIAHLFNHGALLTDRSVAATAVQILGMASISGRFFGGWVLRFIAIRIWALLNVVGQGCGLAMLALATDRWDIWAGALVFGLTVGNLLMLQPLLVVEAFGLRSYARIYATCNAVTTVGVGGGSLLLGLLFERGGYGLAYVVAAGLSCVAFCILAAAGALPDANRKGESLAQSR